MRTFNPLTVIYVCGGLVVFVGGIVDVVPELESVARVQRPQLSRCVGLQPIRGHPSVAVGAIIESERCIP